MRTKLLISSAILAASLIGSSAQAAEFLTITGPSGVFGDGSVGCGDAAGPCSFTRTFQFVTPAGFNITSIDISSVLTGGNAVTDIDFSSVKFNGVDFNSLSTGTQEFRNLLNQNMVVGGNNVLNVMGTTGGSAAFSGNISFGAVPEPATWLFMLVGMAAIGFSMRRKEKTTLRVRYA